MRIFYFWNLNLGTKSLYKFMGKKFLKRYIEECPLTDFTDNGNVNERLLQLDEYLEKFTSYLYNNEPKLTQHFWEEYFASSQVLILQSSAFLKRAFVMSLIAK